MELHNAISVVTSLKSFAARRTNKLSETAITLSDFT